MDRDRKNAERSATNLSVNGITSNYTNEIGVLPAALAAVTVILILLNIYGGRKGKRSKIKSGLQVQRKLRMVSYFPIRLPAFMEGVYTLYRFQRDGLKFWQELHSKYGDIFEYPAAHQIHTFVADPAAIQKLLMASKPEYISRKHIVCEIIFVDALKDGLIYADYGVWSVHRKILSRCFTYKSLQTYLPYMNERGKSLVSHFRSLCTGNSQKSVSRKQIQEAIWSETFKIIIQTMIGEDIFEDGGHIKLQDTINRLKEITAYRTGRPYLLIKPIWHLHPIRKEYEKLIEFTRSLIYIIIDKFNKKRVSEVKQAETDTAVKEFRSLLEELVYSGASEKEIFDEVATFAIAGHETVSSALNILLFHLASNPQCQKLCQVEVDQFLQSKKEKDETTYNLTMEDLANFKYVERCILEGLRLSPTLPLFVRYLEAPLQLTEDLTLKENSTVLFSPWCVHRDPKNFPNPTKFDPDRFLPENVKGRHSASFIPFSIGARNCIGYKFAMMELKTILVLILRHFDVFTTDKPEDINYYMEVTLIPDKELNIVLTKRH